MEHLKLSEFCQHLTQMEECSTSLYDLTIERQVQLLEYMKRHKDIERGKCRGKGFGNCWKLNSKRHPKVFTFLEEEFYKLARDFDLELNHEVRVRVKDRLNRWHIFKLDFLESTTRINVEVSPNWHKNYLLVARRDALRRRLLKKVGIRSLTVPVIQKGRHGHIDYSRARKICKIILSSTASPNSLDYYVRQQGGEF